MDVLEPKTDPVPRHIAERQFKFYSYKVGVGQFLTQHALTPEEIKTVVAEWRLRNCAITQAWAALPQPPEGGQGR